MKTKIFISIFFIGIQFVYSQKKNNENYELAKQYFDKNDLLSAKKVIDEGLENDHTDSDLRMLLGKFYFLNNELDSARYHLFKTLEFDKNNYVAKELLVQIEIKSKHYSSAICYINELLESSPYDKNLWRKKIELYKLQGNFQEASRLFDRLSHIYPNDLELTNDLIYLYQQEIYKLKKEGKESEARLLAKKILEIEIKDEKRYIEVLQQLVSLEDKETSIKSLDLALKKFPNNLELIKLKINFLVDSKRFSEALDLVRSLSKKNKTKEYTEIENQILLEYARFEKDKDPYVLYAKLFERKTFDRESFDYIVHSALLKRDFYEALNYLKKAKSSLPNDKKILFTEFVIYKEMGNLAKSDECISYLFSKFPDDWDINYEFESFKFRKGKEFFEKKDFANAIENLKWIVESKNTDFLESALSILYECYLKENNLTEAKVIIDKMIATEALNFNHYLKRCEWYFLKNEVLNGVKDLYDVIDHNENFYSEYHKNGFEEISVKGIRLSEESDKIADAYEIAKLLLEIKPNSDLGLHYAIKLSSQMGFFEESREFVKQAILNYPTTLKYQIKNIELLQHEKQFSDAELFLDSLYKEFPFNDKIKSLYAFNSKELADVKCKEKKFSEALEINYNGMQLDSTNVELKTQRGKIFENLRQYDSAFYFQKYYKPSISEVGEFKRHLNFLKNKTFSNTLTATYLRSRIEASETYFMVTSLEYNLKKKKNSWGVLLNYTGRDLGSGIQISLENYHLLNKKWYLRSQLGYGSLYFPKYLLNVSAYYSGIDTYEIEFGGGYRKINESISMTYFRLGAAKDFENFWLSGKINYITIDNTSLYNVSSEARFYLFGERNSMLQIVGGIGNASDLQSIDFKLYNSWNAFNTMVGAGPKFMLDSQFSVGFLGTWQNIKVEEETYKNLYNIYFYGIYSF